MDTHEKKELSLKETGWLVKGERKRCTCIVTGSEENCLSLFYKKTEGQKS